MITMTVRVKAYKDSMMEFEQTLEGVNLDTAKISGLINKWQNENGCVSYQLHSENVGNYFLESEWHSRDDLNNHFRSKNFTLFLGAINVLCEHREVKIVDGESTLGIEAIENARAEKHDDILYKNFKIIN